jgi:hypothetical protein
MLAYLVGAPWAIAMGDDSIETFTEGATAAYAAYGINVKMFRRCEKNSFEFCSHRFIDGVAVPLNWDKGLYRLLSAAPDLDRVTQFADEYRHSPEKERCMRVIFRVWQELGKEAELNAI